MIAGFRAGVWCVCAGTITLLALKFLTQYFYFIPKACISSVLVCAVIFMVSAALLDSLCSNKYITFYFFKKRANASICISITDQTNNKAAPSDNYLNRLSAVASFSYKEM